MNYEYQPTCQVPPAILDGFYSEAFGVKDDGVLVEVGAHDGWHWSCTWGLAKRGWKSLYVEPVRELFEQCKETHRLHPNASVINCCAGADRRDILIGMGEYGASIEAKTGLFQVHQRTLDDILESNGIPPGFDLLVIDVEGYEQSVLDGFSVEKWHPKMIIIERPPVPNKILGFGYNKVYEDWINTIYVK